MPILAAPVRINAAESNRAALYYIAEVAWGITPSTGVVKEMRITKSTLAAKKQTKVSNEIRADRMVSSIIEVGATSDGAVDWEMSFGSQDDFWAQFLLSSWSMPMTALVVKGNLVSVTGTSTIVINGTDYSSWLTTGRYIKLEGFTNLQNNGYFTISAASYSGSTTTITVTETGLVTETGNAHSKLFDAGDVISKNTTTAFASGNTVTGVASTTSLQVAQKVFIDGLGWQTGSITFSGALPAAGDTLILGDGNYELTFEFNTASSYITPGHLFVAIASTDAAQATALAAAINAQYAQHNLAIFANNVSTGLVDLTNQNRQSGVVMAGVGSSMTISAFSGGAPTEGGFFTVASIVSSSSFTTVEPLGVNTNSGSAVVVIKASSVRNQAALSSIVKQSMSIETGFTDVSRYFLQNGHRLDSFKMEVKVGDIVTGSFDFKGSETIPGTASFLNTSPYTVLSTTNTEVMNATADVGAVSYNGSPLSLALMEITLTGKNTLREQKAVGSLFPAGVGYGRFMLSGTMEAYFQDLTFYTSFINHTTVSLSFSMTDVDTNTMWFTVPALKITSDPIAPEKIDTDVMEKMSWEAQRDPATNTQLIIDRFSSTWGFTRAGV